MFDAERPSAKNPAPLSTSSGAAIPMKRISKAPSPPMQVGGSCWMPPPRTQTIPSKPLAYRFALPEECRNQVRVEMLRADETFVGREKSQNLDFREREDLAIQWICQILGAFAKEACHLARSGDPDWSPPQVERRVYDVLRLLALEAECSKFVGGNRPELTAGGEVRESVFARISRSTEWTQYTQSLEDLCRGTKVPADGPGQGADQSIGKWEDLEIRFLSDERVQIFIRGRANNTRNFAEMGFEDLRGNGGKPNAAWHVLHTLAANNGISPDKVISGQQAIQKRMQQIRKVLGAQFGLPENPIRFVDGTGYVTSFKITRSLACDT